MRMLNQLRQSVVNWWEDDALVIFHMTNIMYACFCVNLFVSLIWVLGV